MRCLFEQWCSNVKETRKKRERERARAGGLGASNYRGDLVFRYPCGDFERRFMEEKSHFAATTLRPEPFSYLPTHHHTIPPHPGPLANRGRPRRVSVSFVT